MASIPTTQTTLMKLVTLQNIEEKSVRTIVPDLEIVRVTRQSVVAEVADADILIGHPGDRWAQILKNAPLLKWVHVGSAGVDDLVGPEFQQSKVILTCAKGDVAGPVLAEHSLALMLGLSRGIGECARVGNWIGSESPVAGGVFEWSGKTLGLVGFGGVGQHLARMVQGFNMSVIAVRRSPANDHQPAVTVWGPERFHEMLGLADVVVVSVPDVPATRGMFNSEAFLHMKKTAILITVGRGKAVDTEALVHALQTGEIGGAGLDVVDPEPLPDDSPLWRMNNVIITSHNAGTSPERTKRNQALILENLTRFATGHELIGVVNRHAGY